MVPNWQLVARAPAMKHSIASGEIISCKTGKPSATSKTSFPELDQPSFEPGNHMSNSQNNSPTKQ